MKLVSSLASVVAIVSFGLSLFFAQYAVGFYAVAFSASLVLILATDYSPRSRGWEPRSLKLASHRSAQRLQLAA
jgi:hypothetical protein